jgi:hypothetical protein
MYSIFLRAANNVYIKIEFLQKIPDDKNDRSLSEIATKTIVSNTMVALPNF